MLFPKDYAGGANARRVLRYRDMRSERIREEWQVDRLTSSILMPQELVEQAMSLVGQNGRIDNEDERRIHFGDAVSHFFRATLSGLSQAAFSRVFGAGGWVKKEPRTTQF